MQIFHFTVRYAYLREGKRVFYFVSKPKIFPDNSLEHQIEDKQQFSKLISLFWKQLEGKESLFSKEKQAAHYMHMHSIFRFFLKHRHI